MRTGKQLILSVALIVGTMGSFAHATTDRLEGTWECYGPGQTHPLKPPIVWFGAGTQGSIEVDGFGGSVTGSADLSTGEGTIRVATRQGAALLIRGLNDAGRKVSMNLSREGVGEYRCHRLPAFDTPMIPRNSKS